MIRYEARKPKGLIKSWFIWDCKKSSWVSDLRGRMRKFGSESAAFKATKIMNDAE